MTLPKLTIVYSYVEFLKGTLVTPWLNLSMSVKWLRPSVPASLPVAVQLPAWLPASSLPFSSCKRMNISHEQDLSLWVADQKEKKKGLVRDDGLALILKETPNCGQQTCLCFARLSVEKCCDLWGRLTGEPQPRMKRSFKEPERSGCGRIRIRRNYCFRRFKNHFGGRTRWQRVLEGEDKKGSQWVWQLECLKGTSTSQQENKHC